MQALPTLNAQLPEPIRYSTDGSLEVMEVFHTIQGEGPFAGSPAVFVRLAGCNLQCPHCDTDYTSKRTICTPETLVQMVLAAAGKNLCTRLVVITGGEPFRQNIADFIDLLLDRGDWKVQVETNGTLYLPSLIYTDRNLIIVCSPKTPGLNKRLLPHIAAFKYVLEYGHVDGTNGLPTRVLGLKQIPWHWAPDKDDNSVRLARVYVQPMDSRFKDENGLHMKAAVESSLNFGYKLCLQMHKYAGLR